eukprot:gnl/Chilomastix_caulleri/1459.p2 GENE.gnl/Chilomastix_caulleri/1459~~gnl/Chilomastix_caulleri/1459.p2  ORF type:complete len:120 (-),score=31.72 gnl/Chilomastix_caulleri/1459:16-375(-)
MRKGDEEVEKMYKLLQPIKAGQRMIGDEIDEQQQQISDLAENMTETNELIKRETAKLNSFKQYSKRIGHTGSQWQHYLGSSSCGVARDSHVTFGPLERDVPRTKMGVVIQAFSHFHQKK